MGSSTRIVVEHDLDGGTAEESATIGLDSRTYEIDLNERRTRPSSGRHWLSTSLPGVGVARVVGEDPHKALEQPQAPGHACVGSRAGLRGERSGRLAAGIREAYGKRNR